MALELGLSKERERHNHEWQEILEEFENMCEFYLQGEIEKEEDGTKEILMCVLPEETDLEIGVIVGRRNFVSMNSYSEGIFGKHIPRDTELTVELNSGNSEIVVGGESNETIYSARSRNVRRISLTRLKYRKSIRFKVE